MLLYSSSNMSRKISSPCVDSDIEKKFKNKRKRGQKIDKFSTKENHLGERLSGDFFFFVGASLCMQGVKKQHMQVHMFP